MMSEHATGRIRFIKAPKGQAPDWVREAWIGVTVPCYPTIDTPEEGRLFGVDDDKPVSSYECVAVPQKEAIEALEQRHPDAAQWWREHGFGGDSSDPFAFNVESFEIISGVQRATADVYDDLETGRWESRDSGR